MSTFTDQLLALVVKLFQPLTSAFADVNALSSFLVDFGWRLDPNDSAWGASASSTLNSLFGSVTSLVTGLSSDPDQIPTDIANLISAIEQLSTTTANPSLPSPLGTAAFWSSFPQQLYPYLIFTFVRDEIPVAFGILRFIGVFKVTPQPANPNATPPTLAYKQYSIDWSQLDKAVSDPQHLAQDLYGWSATLDYDGLLGAIGDLLRILPILRFPGSATVGQASSSLLSLYYNASGLQTGQYNMLSVVPQYFINSGQPLIPGIKAALVALPIPPAGQSAATSVGPPNGLAIFPLITGKMTQSIPVADNVQITLNGDFTEIPVIAEIRPGTTEAVTINTSIGAKPTLDAEARIDAKSSAGWVLFGSSDSSYFSLQQAHLKLGANGPISDITYKIEGGVDQAQLVISFGDGDSFIQTIFGSQQQQIAFSSILSWSNKTGFGFSGNTNLQLNVPLHVSLLGLINIDTLTVGLNPGGPSIPLAISGDVSIGPLQATVDKIGFQIDFAQAPDHKGTFGDVDVQLSFKPPNGLGIDLDLGPVSGGGYISYDQTKKEYAGILDAEFGMPMEGVELKLIAILDTVLPDGSNGYSFLLIVTVDFPPIQLGFGFTLNGVGGLAGINRSMVLDSLQTAVHNGTADDILFPADPIANAVQIISTLSAVFPPATGRYTFGPMLELGWGTPLVLDVQLGLIIEIPDPIRLAILGLINVGVPTLEEPELLLIEIHIDVVGTIDFDKKQLKILATIYDSRVVEFSLAGDMYLELDWGDAPQFVASLGGFNPHFQPPAGVPSLQRLSISLGASDVGIDLTAYLAVTSNTFQVGADLQASAQGGGFSIKGYLGFDALFIFHPFSFIVEMYGGVNVMHDSSVLFQVSLDLKLSGPSPWNAQGTASFQVLFASISIGVNFTIGDPAQNDPLPQVAVMPQLTSAVNDIRNWSAQLGADLKRSVSLANVPQNGQVVVHPMGSLQVDERIVPLDYPITKFGNDAPSDGSTFSIATAQLNGQNLDSSQVTTIQDYFARGQFVNMSDGDKLAAKSFELFDSGVQIGAADVAIPSSSAPMVESFTTYYVDDLELASTRTDANLYQRPMDLTLALLGQSPSAAAPVRSKGDVKYLHPGTKSPVVVSDALYVVANNSDLSINSQASPATGVTQAQAIVNLRSYVAQNPSAVGTVEVIALYEAAA